MINPINKHTVLKMVRTTGEWKGYVAPNKACVPSVWNIECSVTIVSGKEVSGNEKEYYIFNADTESFQELNTWLNSYAYYNCNSELGNRIRFWEEK